MGTPRWKIAGAMVVFIGLLPTRAAAGVRTVKDLEGIPAGTRARVEGTMSFRGSTPFTILVLETEAGAVVALESRVPGLQRELRGLGGLRVAVEGAVLPRIDPGPPRLDAERYDLLPLPGGERPIVGVLEREDDACIVTTRENKRYWILGELAPALCDYVGARVWIVGHRASGGAVPKPKQSTPFTPTGYGVIDPAPQP